MDIKITDVIRKADMGQSGFARKMGIPLSTVQHWCEGITTPPQYLVNLLDEKVNNLKKDKIINGGLYKDNNAQIVYGIYDTREKKPRIKLLIDKEHDIRAIYHNLKAASAECRMMNIKNETDHFVPCEYMLISTFSKQKKEPKKK